MKYKNDFLSLSFDDILLVPSPTVETEHRKDIDISSIIGNPKQPESQLKLHTPIMIAPMEFISTTKMLLAIDKLGGLGFVQRFQSEEKRLDQIKEVGGKSGFAISIDECYDNKLISKVRQHGCRVFLIDTAVGYSKKGIDALKKLRDLVGPTVHISTGNVATYESYDALMSSGADSVRVGIGGGAACVTRVVTGFGAPTLGSIMDVYENISSNEVNGIIADGGIKQNGDIVKSFAAGASAAMMGNLFAGHDECDGILENGQYAFRGLASEEMQKDFREEDPKWAFYVEGAAGQVKSKGTVSQTIMHMINNIRSGLSYCDVDTLQELRDNASYIKATTLTAVESNKRI